MVRIGVLALQGAVSEHLHMAERAGACSKAVKCREDLDSVDALVIPGGESTAISRMIHHGGLADPIRAFAGSHPVLGTCAGLILCSREVNGPNAPEPLGLMDISVDRNGFGRQADSFETALPVDGIGIVPAVFIRAPFISHTGPEVRTMAVVEGRVVMAEQGNVLVAAFHPELTDDLRVYEYFIDKAKRNK